MSQHCEAAKAASIISGCITKTHRGQDHRGGVWSLWAPWTDWSLLRGDKMLDRSSSVSCEVWLRQQGCPPGEGQAWR